MPSRKAPITSGGGGAPDERIPMRRWRREGPPGVHPHTRPPSTAAKRPRTRRRVSATVTPATIRLTGRATALSIDAGHESVVADGHDVDDLGAVWLEQREDVLLTPDPVQRCPEVSVAGAGLRPRRQTWLPRHRPDRLAGLPQKVCDVVPAQGVDVLLGGERPALPGRHHLSMCVPADDCPKDAERQRKRERERLDDRCCDLARRPPLHHEDRAAALAGAHALEA